MNAMKCDTQNLLKKQHDILSQGLRINTLKCGHILEGGKINVSSICDIGREVAYTVNRFLVYHCANRGKESFTLTSTLMANIILGNTLQSVLLKTDTLSML